MKIVSWNCNGALRRKFEQLAVLNADVFVIQECEDPATSSSDYQRWAGQYVWAGKSPNRGIGVFVKNGLSILPLNWPQHGLQQFLPVRIDDRINLLAVWTKKCPEMGYIGQFWQYIQHHAVLLDQATIICGDFNSNAIWDKRGRYWNHSECVAVLEQQGFHSLYHRWMEEKQGRESKPTLYLQRNMTKPYHIDYYFAHEAALGERPAKITVGQAADWLSFSDHMPVSLELQPFPPEIE
jgi:exonuclease III